MRIALFSSTADVSNGYGNITAEYCRVLHERGIKFTLFLPKSEEHRVAALGWKFPVECVLPLYIFEMRNPRALLYYRAVDVSRFDIVHSLFDFPTCVIAARSARRHRRPFMMGAQGTYGVVPLLRFPDRFALEQCYRQAKAIVVPSEFTRKTILDHTRRPYDITVIHNGVNFGRFQRAVDTGPIRRLWPGRKILLTVGGLKERKGQDLVIRALAQAKQYLPPFVYVIVGDGPMRSAWNALAQECGIADSVVFAGAKGSDELVAYFQACDLYVHTPRVVNYNFEGFGIVYLEAGACGKPSVATDAGGVANAVQNGETGIILPDGDVDGIADAVKKILGDPVLAERLGSAAREYARKHDWPLIVDQFQNLYASILRR